MPAARVPVFANRNAYVNESPGAVDSGLLIEDSSTAALAIAWVLAQGDHMLAIPGTRSLAHFQQLLDGANLDLGADGLAAIDAALPPGWCAGDRYSEDQWIGSERYC